MEHQHLVLYKRQCLLFNSIHYWEDTTVEVSMEVSRFKFKLYFSTFLYSFGILDIILFTLLLHSRITGRSSKMRLYLAILALGCASAAPSHGKLQIKIY